MVGQTVVRPQESRRPLYIYTLPGFLGFVSLMLVVSLVILMLSVLAGLRLGDILLRPNPFMLYEPVWPGQSITSLSRYAQQTPEGAIPCNMSALWGDSYPGLVAQLTTGTYTLVSTRTVCMYAPDSGPFRWMNVVVEGERVQELNLFSDVLHQDALFLYWGAPDTIARSGNDEQFYLRWDRDTYQATASIHEPDLSVNLVTIVAKS